ncbi:MAG: lytic transglycosylase domain-containing protein [Christensenellales bacterium]|jgi:soluble lytic murein transglycosylase
MAKSRRRYRELPAKHKKAWLVLCLVLIWGVGIALRLGVDIYFPLKYQDLIVRYSKEFSLKEKGIDEYHIAAIIRTESRFNEKAESKKGAIGLMQILPDTGAWAAEKIGIGDYTADSLWNPEVNIRIGCWYLAYLSDMFNGDLIKVFAAYNAGPTNVKNWLEDDGKLVNIGHAETQGYVIRVEKYYDIYKALYSDF